jgi:hypothetical protein
LLVNFNAIWVQKVLNILMLVWYWDCTIENRMFWISEKASFWLHWSNGNKLTMPHYKLLWIFKFVMFFVLRFDLKLIIHVHWIVYNIMNFKITNEMVLFNCTQNAANRIPSINLVYYDNWITYNLAFSNDYALFTVQIEWKVERIIIPLNLCLNE